jgi:hypothetical protein
MRSHNQIIETPKHPLQRTWLPMLSGLQFMHPAGFAIANAVVVIAAIRCLCLWMQIFDLDVDDLRHLLYEHYLERMLVASEFWLLVGLICTAATFWLSGLRRIIVFRLSYLAMLTLGVSLFAFRWTLPTLFRLV